MLKKSSVNDGGIQVGHDPSIRDPILEAAENLGVTQQPQGDPYLVQRSLATPRVAPPGKETPRTPSLPESGDKGAPLLEDAETPNTDKSEGFIVDRRDGTGVRELDHYPVDGPKNIFMFNFKNINKRERKGSAEDVANLTSVFEQTDYNVEPYQDLNQADFLDTLNEISQRKELSQSKVFVLVIMSHGNRTDGQHFLTSDGKSVNIDRVRTMFNDRHCPQLKGKPKIFLAVFCRRLRESKLPDAKTADSTSIEPAPQEATKTRSSDSGLRESDFSTQIEVTGLEEVGRLLSLLEESLSPTEIEQINQGVSPETAKAVSALTIEDESKTSAHLDLDEKSNNISENFLQDQLPPILVRPKDFNDMMTMYACKKGYRSVRKFDVGSRFIIAFCQAVAQNGWRYNLNRLYADIEMKMAEYCPDDSETMEGCDPDMESSKFKTCYLF